MRNRDKVLQLNINPKDISVCYECGNKKFTILNGDKAVDDCTRLVDQYIDDIGFVSPNIIVTAWLNKPYRHWKYEEEFNAGIKEYQNLWIK